MYINDTTLFFLIPAVISILVITIFRSKIRTTFRILAFHSPFNITTKILFLLGGVKIGNNVYFGSHVKIMRNVIIGSNSRISSFVFIGSNTKISETVTIGRNAHIVNSEIGNNCRVNPGSRIIGTKSKIIVIGSNSTIGYYSILDGSGGLKIGSHVHIASPSVGIWTHSSINNAISGINLNTNEYDSGLNFGKVTIGDNVWIGGNTTIYPDTKISDKCVILPNSVINKNLESNYVYGGSPGRKIKSVSNLFELNE